MGFLPGYTPAFAPLSIPGAVLPASWWNLGIIWYWNKRKTSYFNKTRDVMPIIPILGGKPILYVGHLDVAQQIVGREGQLAMHKPEDFADAFELWGPNLFTVSGDVWKRHRRVMGPAFNPKTYELVVQETTSIYRELTEAEGWNGKSVVTVPNVTPLTHHTAFLTISRCGFGIPLKWVATEMQEGIDLHATFDTVLKSHLPCLLIPDWMFRFPIQYLKNILHAKASLMDFMKESIQSRSKEISSDPTILDSRGDVFTKLAASSMGLDKYSIDIQEVIGNLFVLMFAGHETTGIVLAETIALLAIHQEEQEKAYQEIMEKIGDLDPTFETIQQLSHTLACFLEAGRIYPPGTALIRVVDEDTVVKVQNPEPANVLIKKGTMVAIDMVSIHHNPHSFPNPEAYMPSRWYGVPESQHSMFGFGTRACIGRKFSHLEALTFLTLLLRDWKLDVILRDGETREGFATRVMSETSLVGLSFGVSKDLEIQLTARN
ncbi:614/534 cytochrome P450 [Coprinopsis cinerea AmutBmut pab1-1]|nr:614/534 cytochrome P450 [Coprinopsis cinerea AmutBmut pab1-1]